MVIPGEGAPARQFCESVLRRARIIRLALRAARPDSSRGASALSATRVPICAPDCGRSRLYPASTQPLHPASPPAEREHGDQDLERCPPHQYLRHPVAWPPRSRSEQAVRLVRGRPFVGERHGELLIRTRDPQASGTGRGTDARPSGSARPASHHHHLSGCDDPGDPVRLPPRSGASCVRSGEPQSGAAVIGRGRSWHDFSNRVQGRLGR